MLVKREAVRSAGGFRAGPLELFLDLHTAARATASPERVAFLASPVSSRPAAGTWGDLRRQAMRDQRQLAAALRRTGTGGGREFFGLFCLRALRPLLETAAYILAAAGWITGLVPPALAALVLVDEHRRGNRDLDGGRRAARTCRTQRYGAGAASPPCSWPRFRRISATGRFAISG